MQTLKAIDLFCGIGGIKQGLQKAGFDVVYSNDIDRYCKITFEENFPGAVFDNRDISTIPVNEIPDHDLLAAGFPCQPFSMAGHKKGFIDRRGNLFFTIVNILREKRPKAFLLENVKNLRGHNKGNTLKSILYFLREELKYNVPDPVILNSKNFGLPQNRERIYIVGFSDHSIKFEYPKGDLTYNAKIKDILEDAEVDESYFLSQKYYEGLANHKERHQAKGNGFGFEVLDLEGVSHALVVGNMGRERNLVQDKLREGFYKSGMDKSKSINSFGVRRLTIRECARLQGFPESFKFPVSKTQAYKQLGNTVSIPVVQNVAAAIINILAASNRKEAFVMPSQSAFNSA